MRQTAILLLLLALSGLAGRPAAGQVPTHQPRPAGKALSYQLTGKVLSISDIHFALPDDKCLQTYLWNSPDTVGWYKYLKQDTAVPTYGWGGPQDTHFGLLTSALNQMQQACAKPDFIVITGDFIAHELYPPFPNSCPESSSSQDTAQLHIRQKINQFLAGQIRQRFPTTPVLTGLGNNDTDSGDDMFPSPAYLDMFANTWVHLMHYRSAKDSSRFITDFKRGGYYSYALPGGGSLLMLNSVVFMPRSAPLTKNDLINRRVTFTELTWLTQQLSAATNVWVAMHVPFGLDIYKVLKGKSSTTMWCDSAATAYAGLATQYGQRIQAGLAGHTHMNEFRVEYPAGAGSPGTTPTTFLHITPAISPVFYNNPGFQVLLYTPADLVLRDCYTSYLQVQPLSQTWSQQPGFYATYLKTANASVPLPISAASLQLVQKALAASTFGTSYQAAYAKYFANVTGDGSALYGGQPPTDPTAWSAYLAATSSIAPVPLTNSGPGSVAELTQRAGQPAYRLTKRKVKIKAARPER